MNWYLSLLLLLIGCSNRPIAKKIKSIHLTSDISQSKRFEALEAEDCTHNLFGNNLGPPPSVYKAFINSNKNGEIKNITNLSIETTFFNLFFYRKSCYVVKGRGGK